MQEPQETWIRSLVWEDPTFGGATKLMNHNFWACALEPVIHSRKRSHCSEKASSVQPESRPRSPQLARGPWSNEDPAAQPKINKRIQLFLKNDRNCASSTGHAGHGDIVFEDLLVPTCACVRGRPAQPSPALPCRTLCSGWAAQLLMNQSLKPPACMSSSWSLSPLPARPNSEDSKGSWCIPDAGNGYFFIYNEISPLALTSISIACSFSFWKKAYHSFYFLHVSNTWHIAPTMQPTLPHGRPPPYATSESLHKVLITSGAVNNPAPNHNLSLVFQSIPLLVPTVAGWIF